MTALPWFRMYHRMVDDEKLRLLAFEDRWHFVALCCLKADGLLDEPETDLRSRKIAVKLGVQVRELEEIGRRLSEVGLVNGGLHPLKWDELQYRSDSSAERVRKFREKQKAATAKPDGNVTVTPQDTETDADTKQDEPKGSKARVAEFPCPADVDPVDWAGLVANRKSKRAPLTEAAHRGIVRKLDAWEREGWPPGPIVANAAERGWTTVFETDEMKAPQNGHRVSQAPRQQNAASSGIAAALDRRIGLGQPSGEVGRRNLGAGSGHSIRPLALPGPGK